VPVFARSFICPWRLNNAGGFINLRAESRADRVAVDRAAPNELHLVLVRRMIRRRMPECHVIADGMATTAAVTITSVKSVQPACSDHQLRGVITSLHGLRAGLSTIDPLRGGLSQLKQGCLELLVTAK